MTFVNRAAGVILQPIVHRHSQNNPRGVAPSSPPADPRELPFPVRSPRVLALDGLRGMACLMVMAIHMYDAVPGGFLGVDLFFVLSGFLITRLLLEEHQRHDWIDLKTFYLRRCFRLLPALLAWFGAAIVFSAVFLSWRECRETCQAALIVVCAQANRSDMSGAIPLSFFQHAWSLSVEDKFYVAWPFALCALLSQKRVSRRTLVALVAGTIVGCAVLRALVYHANSPAPFAFLYRDFTSRADALLIGCLGAMLTVWNMLPRGTWSRRVLNGLSVAAIAGLAFGTWKVTHQSAFLYQGGFTLVAVGGVILVLTLVHAPRGLLARVLENRALCWTGRLSYGLYLWHIPLMMYGVVYHPRLTGGGDFMGGPLSYAFRPTIVALTYAVAALSYFCVERPFLRMGAGLKARHAENDSFPLQTVESRPSANNAAHKAANQVASKAA